jgi:hypothetical protein
VSQANSDLHLNKVDSVRKLSISGDRDKRAYLKILERSVRTGREIQEEIENIRHDSGNNSVYSLRQYIDKHLSSTTTNNPSTAI